MIRPLTSPVTGILQTLPKKGLKKLLRFFLWISLLVFRVIVPLIPSRIRPFVGSWLGSAAYFLLGRERKKTLTHLRMAYGEEKQNEEIRRIALNSFRNLGQNFLDTLRLDRIKEKEFGKTIRMVGGETLRKLQEKGRGIIFITGHIGNWELMGAFLAKTYPVAVVAAPIYDRRVEKLMIRARKTHGIETFVRDSPGITKKILNFLREGGIVGILIDQDTRTAGVHVPFFNRMAFTTTGPANLALRTRTPVVCGIITRLKGNSHHLKIEGPLPLRQTGNREADLRENTAYFTRIFEEFVRQDPDQWVWMHRRWRTPLPENPLT